MFRFVATALVAVAVYASGEASFRPLRPAGRAKSRGHQASDPWENRTVTARLNLSSVCQNHPQERASFRCCGCDMPLCGMCIYGDEVGHPSCEDCDRLARGWGVRLPGSLLSAVLCVLGLPAIWPGLLLLALFHRRWDRIRAWQWALTTALGSVGVIFVAHQLWGQNLMHATLGGLVPALFGGLFYLREELRVGSVLVTSLADTGEVHAMPSPQCQQLPAGSLPRQDDAAGGEGSEEQQSQQRQGEVAEV